MEAQFSLSIALIIFFADCVYFFLTVFLIDNVVGNKAIKAGFFALLVNFSSQLAVFYFVKNFDYAIPSNAGAFIGAVLATAYDCRKQKNQKDEIAELRQEMKELREEVKKLTKEGKRESMLKKVSRLS
ncbi:MAG: hypothetical protein Q7R92_03495 [bacterium]|nr:hypothetical protein [bacterium]